MLRGTPPAHLLRPSFGASSRASRAQPADIIDNPRASVQWLPSGCGSPWEPTAALASGSRLNVTPFEPPAEVCASVIVVCRLLFGFTFRNPKSPCSFIGALRAAIRNVFPTGSGRDTRRAL